MMIEDNTINYVIVKQKMVIIHQVLMYDRIVELLSERLHGDLR